jgi:hypothetical protein
MCRAPQQLPERGQGEKHGAGASFFAKMLGSEDVVPPRPAPVAGVEEEAPEHLNAHAHTRDRGDKNLFVPVKTNQRFLNILQQFMLLITNKTNNE